MKTESITVREYVSPALTLMNVHSEGILCGSINGIGDLDFIYDENEKE